MDEFKASVVVVLYSSFLLPRKEDTLLQESLLQISNHKLKMDLKPILNDVQKMTSDKRISLDDINNLLTPHGFPQIQKFKSQYWVETLSPYLWVWIHSITPYLDVRATHGTKNMFVDLVYSLVLCLNCKNHYNENRTNILDSVSTNGLTRTFFALHTHIQNKTSSPFKFNEDLISQKYVDRFVPL